VYQVAGLDYDTALRTNAEGHRAAHEPLPANAKAFLHMSTCSVYKPNPDPDHIYTETDPLGDNAEPVLAGRTSISKIAAEGVARACARAFAVRPRSPDGGVVREERRMAGVHVRRHACGSAGAAPGTRPEPARPDPRGRHLRTGPARCSMPRRRPRVVVNWAGDDVVSAEDWCGYMGELTGITPEFAYQDHWITNSAPDPTPGRS
jgi:hypothetical protein